jgi:DamX protein
VVDGWMSMNVATPNTKVIGLNLENREPPIPSISTRNRELSLQSSTLPDEAADPVAVAEVRKEIKPVINDRDAGMLQPTLRRTQGEPTVLGSADPNPWVNQPPSTASVRVPQSNWMLSPPDAVYTLQLMGSHSEARALALIEKQRSGQEFGYVEAKYRNQPWFVLTLGQYPDRDHALRAIEHLLPSLRTQKPWARSVASIRGN